MKGPEVPNHYVKLGVPVDATPLQIREAAARLSQESRGPETRNINNAYMVLASPIKRKIYDISLIEASGGGMSKATEDFIEMDEDFTKTMADMDRESGEVFTLWEQEDNEPTDEE